MNFNTNCMLFTITTAEIKAEVSSKTKAKCVRDCTVKMYALQFWDSSQSLPCWMRKLKYNTYDHRFLFLKGRNLTKKCWPSTFQVFESDESSSSIDFDALYVATTRLFLRLKVNHKLAFRCALWKARDRYLRAFLVDLLHGTTITKCLKTCLYAIQWTLHNSGNINWPKDGGFCKVERFHFHWRLIGYLVWRRLIIYRWLVAAGCSPIVWFWNVVKLWPVSFVFH